MTKTVVDASGPAVLHSRYDVVIVGGSAAGLSAAVALGRARRSVLVIDAGEPRNAPAEGVHNFYTRDGTNPFEMIALGRAEAAGYGVQFLEGSAVAAVRTEAGFDVELASGGAASGRRLLVATGLVDELPEIPGLQEQWGTGVMHCPYCHGWEVRDQKIGILGAGPFSIHQALMWRQWSGDITLFTRDLMEPTAEEYEQLAARGISVVLGAVTSVDSVDGSLVGVTTADGRRHPATGLVVGAKATARAEVLLSLGLELSPHPMGEDLGSFVASGFGGATAVPGVWAAGNVTDLMAQVITAAGGGLMAGAAINADLMAEELAADVAAYRARAEGHTAVSNEGVLA